MVLPFAGTGAFAHSPDATEAERVWQALRRAAGEPLLDGSDAIPVHSWATAAIVYELNR